MSRRKPLTLTTLLGSIFILLSIFLGGVLLFWTYRASINLINTELEKSFAQKNSIAAELLEREAERIDSALYEVRINKELLKALAGSSNEAASAIFIDYADQTARNRLDVLFISRPDEPVWLNASSPFPDVTPVLHHISGSGRSFMIEAQLKRFRGSEADFTGIFKSGKLVLESGEVIGIITGGTVLNDNFTIINEIRSKSKTPNVMLMQDEQIVASTVSFGPERTAALIENIADEGLRSGQGFYHLSNYSLIFTNQKIAFPGDSGLSIILGLSDEVLTSLQRSYFNTLYLISLILIVFLLSMFLLVRRLIYPSISNLLEYTERIALDEKDVALKRGLVIEFNRIGEAMERMVEFINRSQKELMYSEKKMRSYIENAPIGIFVADRTGKYIEVNDAAERITGYSADELLRMDIAAITPPGDRARSIEHFKQLTEEGRSSGEIQFLRKDGSIGFWTVDAVKLTDDLFLGFVSDISERYRMEEQIRASLNEKDVLLQEVHHRVKNNLQLIISLLKIEMMYDEDESSVYRDTISRIRRFSIIYSKLYIQEDIANINFVSTIKESMEEIVSMYSAPDEDVSMEFDIPQPIIPIDKAISLSLIINELVTNSIKYAFTGAGKIRLSLHFNNHGDISKFEYSDDGRGMQSDVQGFGTKLVSILAEQLKLEVIVTSEKGVFYEFRPLNSVLPMLTGSNEILYVEDEFIIAMSRLRGLKELGYNVKSEIIASGEEVLEYIRTAENAPMLIIMDIGLAGELNGIETAREIRKNFDIPILFSSGYEDSEKLSEISEIRNTAYAPKTCSDNEMKGAIDRLLSGKS